MGAGRLALAARREKPARSDTANMARGIESCQGMAPFNAVRLSADEAPTRPPRSTRAS
jgi:hypothetical protein